MMRFYQYRACFKTVTFSDTLERHRATYGHLGFHLDDNVLAIARRCLATAQSASWLLAPVQALQYRDGLKLALLSEANSLLGAALEECVRELCDYELAIAEKEAVRLWELLRQHNERQVLETPSCNPPPTPMIMPCSLMIAAAIIRDAAPPPTAPPKRPLHIHPFLHPPPHRPKKAEKDAV
jgi:hypothetical protein